MARGVRIPAGTPASAGTVGGQGLNTLDANLARLTSAACAAIGWADHASVSVAYGEGWPVAAGSVSTLGATSPVALKADALQWELGVGPSVEAARDGGLVHVDELGRDDRWPTYVGRAHELGIMSQSAVGVEHEGRVVGVLTVYSLSVHALDQTSEALVRLFAAQADAAMGFAARIEALTEAIANRQVIGQAVGIVMERFGLDEAAAFDRLVRESQRRQLKLRRIARTMVGEANVRAI